MERLLPSDPSRLGGYRLLGRLGAGGMAVDINRILVETPPSGGTVHQVAAAARDFGPAVSRALATHPQAVVYGATSPRRAAACARALATARGSRGR
ncbi:hypothetical protein ACFWP5_15115 [Streptomyces sp. NPDC058469]|uniref:hypothetical protein n=1 Tax=Streptomyces sp. NPDC058469 TaxID=3346514 RepID=UPI00364E7300